MTLSFRDAFERELRVVNFRREKLSDGAVATARAKARQGGDPQTPARPGQHFRKPRRTLELEERDPEDGRCDTVRLKADHADPTGMSLSGGGIRSASFSLGVLQALDSLSDHGEPHVLDAVDYLSTVSGGGYIGTALVAGMMQPDYSFPFDSCLDEQEPPEVKHLRDHSTFLAPNGSWDYLTSAALILRGLLVNALIALCPLLLLAVLTVHSNPNVTDLREPDLLGWPIVTAKSSFLVVVEGAESFTLTINLAILLAIVLFVSAIWISLPFTRGTLEKRRTLGTILGLVLLAVCGVAMLEVQPLVLDRMFTADAEKASDTWGPVARLAAVLTPLAAVLVAFAQRLANIAKATLGEATWTGFFKKYAARGAIYAAGLIVPLLLWAGYLYLSFWAIAAHDPTPCFAYRATVPDYMPEAAKWMSEHGMPVLSLLSWNIASDAPCYRALTPEWLPQAATWLVGLGMPDLGRIGALGSAYLLVAAAIFLLCLVLSPNANSLHLLYRDRLSTAFLFDRLSLAGRPPADDHLHPDRRAFTWLKPLKEPKEKPSWPRRIRASLARWRPKRTEAPPAEGQRDGDARETQGSEDWNERCAYAPYLLINTAINLEGSRELNKRGRNADSFTFSPLAIGSSATGYATTEDFEATRRDLTLATAMATSGAAASANMGAATIKVLTFSLSLLNVRLGYWLTNPSRLSERRNPLKRWLANIGVAYFALETGGFLSQKTLNVYLTDGGYFENLGIYELLRRRSKVIIAVDAEADQELTFPSLLKLEVIARIDLGIRIDLPWQAIQAGAAGVDASPLYGRGGYPGLKGPHAAIGRIEYGPNESGVLIYLKSSLSGDENDYILDYKRRNTTFPHETTVDQFFSEEQFEVYRALGFHVARGLFAGDDSIAVSDRGDAAWMMQIKDALTLLNITERMACNVVCRCGKPPNPVGSAPPP